MDQAFVFHDSKVALFSFQPNSLFSFPQICLFRAFPAFCQKNYHTTIHVRKWSKYMREGRFDDQLHGIGFSLYFDIFIDCEAGGIIRLVASVRPSVRGRSKFWNRSKNIYDNQSKVFVCVCYLLLFRQVGRLRSITLLILKVIIVHDAFIHHDQSLARSIASMVELLCPWYIESQNNIIAIVA